MASKVLFHIGLPKTGTTFLQSTLWQHKARLREDGLLVPGTGPRQHLWASAVIRGDASRIAKRHPQAVAAWDKLVTEVNDWHGTAVISHEFFCGATPEQAARAIEDLAPAEVELVLTVRDPLGMVTSFWQEYIKHGFSLSLDEFPRESQDPRDEWSWRTVDLAGVLQRWTGSLPAESVTCVVVPRNPAPGDELWDRFSSVLEIDAQQYPTGEARRNESLGAIEAGLLRDIAAGLTGFESAVDRGVWIRSYLAHEILVPRGSERIALSDQRRATLHDQAVASCSLIERSGFTVVGDLADIVTFTPASVGLRPETVDVGDKFEVALEVIAAMLQDVRNFRRERNELTRELQAAGETVARLTQEASRTWAQRAWARVRVRGNSA